MICINIILLYFNTNTKIFDSNFDRENTDKLLEYLTDNATILNEIYNKGKKRPTGFCFSIKNRFMCFIINKGDNAREVSKTNSKIWYWGKLHIEINKQNTIEEQIIDNKFITIWDRDSDYRDAHIYSFKIPFSFEPYEIQTKIINEIIDFQKSSIYSICRAVVYGKPGCGKSFIGKFLAFKLNGSLATYINLGSPGCGFQKLYQRCSPTQEKPLIIQLDEIDIIIENIHYQKNIDFKHKWMTTEAYNKITYNNFWSEFVTRYPFVIWLCTMNSDIEDINKLDSCYLRKSRMDIICKY